MDLHRFGFTGHRIGDAPSHLGGAETSHPAWTTAAISAAAQTASARHASADIDDSRSSGGLSDRFLSQYQGRQFSRDSDDNDTGFLTLPPPPLELTAESVHLDSRQSHVKEERGLAEYRLRGIEEERGFAEYSSWNVSAQKPLSLEEEHVLHYDQHWPKHPYDQGIWELGQNDHGFMESDVPEPEPEYRAGIVSPQVVRHDPTHNEGSAFWQWSPWDIFGFGREAKENDETRPLERAADEAQTHPPFPNLRPQDKNGLEEIEDLESSGLKARKSPRLPRDSARTDKQQKYAARSAESFIGRRLNSVQHDREVVNGAVLKKNSFRMSRVPSVFGGKVESSGDVTKTSKVSTCSLCSRALYGCRTVIGLISTLALMCCLTGYLWIERDATVTEGAFGLATQTKRAGPMNWHYFRRAQQHTVANLSIISNNNTDNDNGLIWYRLEMVYSSKAGFASALTRMQQIEKQLRGLAGWQKLCEEAPGKDQKFCAPGDSVAAVMYGTYAEVTSPLTDEGVLGKISFDGGGTAPLYSLQQYLKDFHSSFWNRWFAASDPKNPIRSVFAFHLRNTSLKSWISFVEAELQPVLREIVLEGENEKGTFQTSNGAATADMASTKVRVYYRGDSLKMDEFEDAVWNDTDWRTFAPIGAFVATLLLSRRLILAFVASILAICAPVIASILISTNTDGKAEYPVIAVASWFVIATSCVDLAIASESGWKLMKGFVLTKRPFYCGGHCKRIRLFVLFLNDVPLALLPSAAMLYLIGCSDDLPLLQEFTQHTGAGMFFASIFAILVYPPALEVGDMLHDGFKEDENCLACTERSFGLIPFECAEPPSWWRDFSKRIDGIVDALNSWIARLISFTVVLALILGLVLLDIAPTFSSKVPELFHDGHRLREGPRIISMFGSDEFRWQTEPPIDILNGTHTCKADAYDKYQCAWYQCEADNQIYPRTGYCNCYSANKSQVPKSGWGACGAAARFVNLEVGLHDAFAKSTFWQWVEEGLNISLHNNSRTAEVIGRLEVEDWQTGDVTSEPQSSAKAPGQDGIAPNFEDACLRVMCYCGNKQCKLDLKTQEWYSLGELASPVTRRLALPPRPTVATTEVFIVLGLSTPTVIPEKSSHLDLVFSGNFDMADPWTQRGMLAACLGTPHTLQIVSRRCWIADFKTWLNDHGESFPVKSENFDDAFRTFLARAVSNSTVTTHTAPTTVVTGVYPYFWVGANNKVKGCYLAYAVSAPDPQNIEAVAEYRALWQSYVSQRKTHYPILSAAWVTSDLFATREAALAIEDATNMIWMYAFALGIIATLLRTWSIGLTIIVLIVLGMCFGTLVFFSSLSGKPDVGLIELLVFCTCMSNFLTPLVRITYQYSIARDGPGMEPSLQDFSAQRKREFKLRSNSLDGTGSFTFFQVFNAISEEQAYLVDNRTLQAGTRGLGYRLSPRLDDIDTTGNSLLSMAVWGSTVRGVTHGPNWLNVGGRFLPMELQGVKVLSEHIDDDDQPRGRRKWFFGRTRAENWQRFKDKAMDYFLHVIVPDDHPEVWEGCCQTERRRRSVTIIKRDGLVILGTALAGIIIGASMVPLRMEALGQIGFACLLSSLIFPLTTLGLLPVLILLPLGPTRSRRRALYTFVQWWREGRPGKPPPQEYGSEGGHESSKSAFGVKSTNPFGVKATKTPERHPGEVAALELGFPFSMAVHELPKPANRMPVRSSVARDFKEMDEQESIPSLRHIGSVPREPALPPIRLAKPATLGVGRIRLPSTIGLRSHSAKLERE